MTQEGPRPPSTARAVGAYGAVAALAFGFFVLLHHVGNRLPATLAAERIEAEFAAESVAWGTRRPQYYDYMVWEYCFFSGAVLAGSRKQGREPLRDALAPWGIREPPAEEGRLLPICDNLRVALRLGEGIDAGANADAVWRRLPHRQWFGAKALYAIGLRYLTVHQYHEFIRKATYAAYALLAAALLVLGWRVLLVASPVLLSGAWLSGIDDLSDVAKGTPYLWAILTPALVALLIRVPFAPASATRLFCFFAGMVSAYLWSFDGGNFVAAALLGLVVWFGCESLAVAARARRAAACVLLHMAGFVVCITGGWLVKMLAGSEPLAWTVASIRRAVGRLGSPGERDLMGRDSAAWLEMVPLGVSTMDLLMTLSVIALLAALLFAGYQVRQRHWEPLQNALWIVGIAPVALIHFVLPNDNVWTSVRLMFLPWALCWAGLAAVLLRIPRPATHLLVFATFGTASVAAQYGWQHFATTALQVTAADRIIQSRYDVHLVDNKLIYIREHCEDSDVRRKFLLELWPVDVERLPPERRASGYLDRAFYYVDQRRFSFDSACRAVVDLPSYPLRKIRTGQWCCKEKHWVVSVELADRTSATTTTEASISASTL